ncbi:PIN2/TERF1-interacting telomerase inhibitor 1 [Vanessa tameamea]|uniref:PIN2/TERF1-interacting telomerase inhibitor 1 n=1 Tax=Vanessa tameamea TaxID=334116 RepID=A0A8B8IX14_VANTA
MSMLAAPRRKQKVINLRAKNNAWSNDTNKFGQKMLEKMGWSAGKGLGAKENGMVDHVVAKYKNDERGLGFEDKNDQWTKHEDDFNALLANLSNAESNAETLHSGVSLEDKSKKSKARIHYHKFTRGKDMSRYSEKDLANIFGKKSLKEKEEENLVQDDVKTSEQVFTEKGNMDDYFKTKLANLKSKSKLLNSKYESRNEHVADYSFKGFSNDTETENETTNSSASQGFSFYNMKNKDNVETTLSDTIIDNNEELVKKKKKSKKKEQTEVTEEHSINADLEINNELQSDTLQETKVKKAKKKKYQEVTEDSVKSEPIKKKKKNKNKQNDEIHEQIVKCDEDKLQKKKKKRKNQNNE